MNLGSETRTDDPVAEAPGPQKVLVHVAYPLWRKQTVMIMARAKELQDRGDEVVLTYCNSKAGTCAANFVGSPVACWICRNRVRSTASALGLRAVPLETGNASAPGAGRLRLSERKELAIGVQSAITTRFRTLPGDRSCGPLILAIKGRYFRTASRLLGALKALGRHERPDRFEVFNGRHACSRICLTAAEGMQVPFNTLEGTTRQKPIIFEGHTAHDRGEIQKRIMKHEADEKVADIYYGRRRQPRTNKFARKHAHNFVPPEAARFKKKVSVFLSSQDEFESLGKDWVSPFLDYAKVVKEACLQNPDHLFCIRFHPNQADVSSDIITPFREIAELANTVIYYPTDRANSYTLIDWSDVVVTFGSTISVEACWMKKPVIMLGPSFFDQLDISYNPKSSNEFLELLRKDLPPKARQNAARFAMFEESDFDRLKYVDSTGKTIVPKGFRLALPWASQLARTADDLLCEVVKKWAGHRAKKKRRAA